MTEKGRVYIIGAGPGDPGLITLRGVQCIREADVIVYDHLVSPEILRHAGEKARLIYAGKQGGDHTLSQWEINALLVAEAGAGGDRREAQGRRSLHLRPGGRGGGGPPGGGHPLRGRSRHQFGGRRSRLCGDPADPPEPYRRRWPLSRAMRIRPRGRATSTGRRLPGSGRSSFSWG